MLNALLAAAADPSRLVRIRTAMSLAALPPQSLTNERDRANLEKANRDFIAAMQARPDDWASHANLGNFYMEGRDFAAAAACFETATKLEPRQIGPMVNASMAYSNMDQNDKAEQSLRRALKMEPANAAANFNLGLLLGEQGRLPEAEQALRTALKADPQMAAAAFNLGVILGEKNLDEAIAWCQKAHELRPTDPKYAHTLAFYQRKKGDIDGAVELLRKVIQYEPSYLDAYLLLGEIYEERHDFPAAAKVYLDASQIDGLPPQIRSQLDSKSHAMQSGGHGQVALATAAPRGYKVIAIAAIQFIPRSASPQWAQRPEPAFQNPACSRWSADRRAAALFAECPPGRSGPSPPTLDRSRCPSPALPTERPGPLESW